MSGFDFQPFPANCGTLSVSENALCSSVFDFVENNATIYTSQRSYIEKSLMKKIKQWKFNAILACKAFENMLIRHKKYIVEELNKNVQFRNTYNLTTKKLNKDIRRHISCLFVNNFISDYEQEIKQELNIKDDSDDETEEEEKEIVIETDKIFIGFSRCGGCENSLNKCTCYESLCDKCDLKLKYCRCDELPEEENFEAMYRKELFFHNETKEELKGASEIINSYKKELNEKDELIKKLVEHTQKMTLENIQLKDEAKNIKVLEIENKMMKRMITKRQTNLLKVHLEEELKKEEDTKKMLEGVENGTFYFPKKKNIII
jgi:hypothetical protein